VADDQRTTLPIMQSCVIVLLKLLLATITGPGVQNANLQNGLPPALTSPTQEQPRECSSWTALISQRPRMLRRLQERK